MADANQTVGFGLMSIACKRGTARITAPSIAYLCVGQPGKATHEASPRKAPYHCDVCGEITDNEVLLRGVKSGKTYTLIDAEKLNEAKESYVGQYADLNIVPHPATDFLMQTGEGDSLYYLTPADAGAANHYAILAALIDAHPELAFVGLYTPKTATSLYHLSVREGVIVMAKRTRTDAMKPIPSVGGTVNEKLLAMLDGSLDSLTEPYDPATYEDTYQQTVAALVDDGEVLAIDATTKAPVKPMTDDELMAKLTLLKSEKKPAKKKAKVA